MEKGGVFSRACSDRTRGDGFRLKVGKFRLDIRKKFTVRVVRTWKRLPRVVDTPSLEMFKAMLDRALSNLVWCKVSLTVAGGWTGWSVKVPSDSNQSVIMWLFQCDLVPKFAFVYWQGLIFILYFNNCWHYCLMKVSKIPLSGKMFFQV